MRWSRKRRDRPEPPPSSEAQRRIEEAKKARKSSEERLEEICDQWPEVRAAAAHARRIREKNGFARIFREVMGGGGS